MSLAVASALTDALVALGMAQRAVNAALALIGAEAPEPPTRSQAAVRTTSTQIMAVLATASGPLTLIDVADGVAVLRRGEDTPRKSGGTRYQEICRSSLARLIKRGLIERVQPKGRHELMRFQRVEVKDT